MMEVRPLVRVRPFSSMEAPTTVDVRKLVALEEYSSHDLLHFDGGFTLAVVSDDGEYVRQVWFRLNGYSEAVK